MALLGYTVGVTRESLLSVKFRVLWSTVLVRLRMNLLGGCALACPFQIRGIILVSQSNQRCQGFQRGWDRPRLATEQGKQPALNSERIASLYSLEGYRLVLIGG